MIVPALSLRGVRVSLGAREVLGRVDLDLPASELVALVGPNGAGKTTLLRVAAGLLRPDAGDVVLGGTDVFLVPPAERARRLAYLPQSRIAAASLHVEAAVRLGRHALRGGLARDGEADRSAVDRALGSLGLTDLRDRELATLSGGELARVLLARALAAEAPILIADEPTAGLDPRYQLEVLAILRGLARAGTAILVTLHDLALASRFADRLVVLDRGRVAGTGSPAEVLERVMAGTFEVRGAFFDHDGARVALPWSVERRA